MRLDAGGSFFAGDPKKTVFDKIVFSPKTKEEFTVRREDVRVEFGPNWRGPARPSFDKSGRMAIDRTVSNSDQAIYFIKTECERFPASRLARLASTYDDERGSGGRLPNVSRNQRLTWLSKKTRPGKPVTVTGFLNGWVRNGDQWKISLDRSDTVDFGDSGGPIFNASGELVGAVSRADRNTMTFSAVGVGWAQRLLAGQSH